MTIRYDKNGIRILDPKANNLPKECHPSLHQWEEDPTRTVRQDLFGLNVPVRCTVCGKKDVESN